MQNDDSIKIVKRFFRALYKLQNLKIIKGKRTFTEKYGINRWNLNTLEKEPDRDIFQVSWLAILVKDYDISSDWLLTGRGKMFTIEPQKQEKFVYKVKKKSVNVSQNRKLSVAM